MMGLNRKIDQLVDKNIKKVIDIRRDIHKHPELSYNEYRTAGVVAQYLKDIGLEIQDNIAKTGITALLQGSHRGKTLLLRADMDALPLLEETNLDFCSINKGVMHACGHDVHTANLLGVAAILSELKDEIKGNVKFVFQPAEENGGGGREMIKEGILDNPKIDAALAMHLWNGDTGKIKVKYGNLMAYSDSFMIEVLGKKAHSSMPEAGVDAILIASQIIVALQTIMSRNISPFDTSTFSIGKISGGTAVNIVPDKVQIDGMMRNVLKETRSTLTEKITNIAQGIAQALGGSVNISFKEGYPAVVNDQRLTDLLISTLKNEADKYTKLFSYNSINMLEILDNPMLGAEDFGFFAQKVPSCFYFVGAGEKANLHTSSFMVDEKLFYISLPLMVKTAINFLNNSN